MKQVTIQELKRHLSKLVSEAEAGEQILVTRHKHPVAQLSSAGLRHLHVGTHFGKAKLRPLLQGESKGRYLKELLRDRREGDR